MGGYMSLVEFYRLHGMAEGTERNLRQRVARILVSYRRRLARAGIPYPVRPSGASMLKDYKQLRALTVALRRRGLLAA